MKTLDEVIKAEEICSQMDAECSICPYKATAKGWCEEKDRDALHYLKEYKKDREDPDGDHQQLEKARALLQEFFANPPLTWDELKQMEGKPVWVDCIAKRWIVIVEFRENWNGAEYFEATDGGLFSAKTQGDSWQAFRKER